jgi:hypothetical protein
MSEDKIEVGSVVALNSEVSIIKNSGTNNGKTKYGHKVTVTSIDNGDARFIWFNNGLCQDGGAPIGALTLVKE